MSKKTNGVPSKSVLMVGRRLRVIDMLNAQLKEGTKTKKIEGVDTKVVLNDKDIIRINKELSILKTRISKS